MAGFGKDEFGEKILSMYKSAKENNYVLKLDEGQVRELKEIYINLYIPFEKLGYYDDAKLMKKLMTAIVSVYTIDRGTLDKKGGIVHIVNSVNFDGKNLYLHYAKISPAKLRRFELGKTQKQIADLMGYKVTTVRNCENADSDLSRQPEALVRKLAKALNCDVETILS